MHGCLSVGEPDTGGGQVCHALPAGISICDSLVFADRPAAPLADARFRATLQHLFQVLAHRHCRRRDYHKSLVKPGSTQFVLNWQEARNATVNDPCTSNTKPGRLNVSPVFQNLITVSELLTGFLPHSVLLHSLSACWHRTTACLHRHGRWRS